MMEMRILDYAISVGLGYILDLIFGDPRRWPHPITLIGITISKFEKIIRKIFPRTRVGELMGGFVLCVSVVSLSFIIPFFILYQLGEINYYLKMVVQTFFCYQILASRSLCDESMKVYYPLIKKDIKEARKYLSWIVGRDTTELTEVQITKATVETVAENTCDGVVAPLIFMIIGGAPLGFLYKAVNTLDSMVGYKNEKYFNFGKVSARVDDILNYIPAIFSAYSMLISAFFLKFDYKNGYKIYCRDKNNHSSPNSGKTESVCAGILGVQLGGDSTYFGQVVKKKTIGDKKREILPDDIIIINKIMYMAGKITLIILLGARIGMVILK